MTAVRGLRRLGPKLFLSYLLIVIVGSLVLWTTAEAVAPSAFTATAAFLAALAVSIFVTRRIVAPIQTMKIASARIAGGRYGERVAVTSDDELGQLAEQFCRMASPLEQIERMRRDLIADVAHLARNFFVVLSIA